MNVLILGGGLQGLSVAFSLYKIGYYIISIANDSMMLNSRFVNKKYKGNCCDLGFLEDVIKKETPNVIIPMGDKAAIFLSKNKELLESINNIKCAIYDYQTVELVHNKTSFMKFCEDNKIPHPITKQLTNENIEECVKNIGFPALIKPAHSVGARGITIVNSKQELIDKLPQIQSQYGSCALQEFIENDDYYYNVMLYRTSDGKFSNYCILKIVRKYPICAGSSSCCITVENEELVNICKKALNILNWVGMADFDVLQNKKSGEYKIIEINPRVPASIRGAAISGINFPQIIIEDLSGHQLPQYKYSPNKVLRYLGIDILWFLKSKNRWKTKPSWFKFFGKDVYYMDIYKKDCSTWYGWLANGLKKFFNRNQTTNS